LQLLKYKLSQRQDLFMIYSRAEFNVFSPAESLTLISALKANEHFYTTRTVIFIFHEMLILTSDEYFSQVSFLRVFRRPGVSGTLLFLL
jgi:hypothetical protein